ncbi:CGNR zinc finger domain-containing protein [Streptacidiphilus sp. ASG 303]|uniref:CGNR zinc finger domain-containing protein n=1 Tax=Streptacidiphilus sp. ASG 303 TaxID=2896847 RepID=UPI001E4FF460|nr:CGNR zinc finger domain-containing protein [Streptacidiphilus sp. ASG 303]MCD0486033.1 CGNR zinc finger domain-containing protein [Streptacidiphilus sp. ASG 303]
MTAAASTGLVLRSPEGTRYLFDPGALCLELLTTGGPGPLARHEVLHAPEDLSRWLTLSRLGVGPGDVRVSPGELATARRLRDALWRLARAAAGGGPWGPGDLAEVNRAAAAPPLAPCIGADRTRVWELPADGTGALSTVARDAVDLFTGPLADRIRECAAHDCFLVFVDASRPGRRRWCAMERCGNRSKTRALRARRATGGTAAPAGPASEDTADGRTGP